MTPADFLTPLARLCTRFPDVEGAVVWADPQGWQPQDDATERLDAEEIAFYVEGLLIEGFSLHWQALAEADTPKQPTTVVLMFWQGARPPAPDNDPFWVTYAEGHYPTAGPP